MKQFFYLVAICMLALTACKSSYKKGDMGLEYKIIKSGSGKTIAYGNYMQMHIKEVYAGDKDTVLRNSREDMPFMSQISVLDSVSTPLAYYKMFSQMRKGDSLIVRLLTDSIYKNSEKGMPPFAKKGKYMYLHLKLVNFFENKLQADSVKQAELTLAKPRIYKKQMEEIQKQLAGSKAQLDIDSKLIEAYLAKNNIKAQKTKWGTYVSITTPGTGENLNNTNIATVNYTGRTLDSGRVFDSNIDPKFNHVQPMEVNVGELGTVILGWTDALMQLKPGSKATVFIPSSLAYGAQGNGAEIKPNENLIFDIEVIAATTEAEYLAKQKAMQEEIMKKMQEQNKNAAPDSLKKGN